MMSIKKLRDIARDISVLYVEDEDELRRGVVLYLKKLFGVVKDAPNGEDAFEIFKNESIDIVIIDIRMPKMDGLELAKRIKEIKPEQEIAVISAYTEYEYFINFIELGVSGYIIKPIDYNQLNSVIYKMAEKISKFRENKMYRVKLENLAEQRAGEITKLHKEKLSNYKQSLMSLIELIENRDTYTAGHSRRVAKYCVKIAREMGFGTDDIKKLYQ
ncbi:MAG: response regulator [Nitrospiraceae bacterium]|nr:response regulator [Nitrospiraceae bacterium]